ncbi:MAG: hypothetical protein AB1Z98_22090 [Nannocystaceae bacterium]
MLHRHRPSTLLRSCLIIIAVFGGCDLETQGDEEPLAVDFRIDATSEVIATAVADDGRLLVLRAGERNEIAADFRVVEVRFEHAGKGSVLAGVGADGAAIIVPQLDDDGDAVVDLDTEYTIGHCLSATSCNCEAADDLACPPPTRNIAEQITALTAFPTDR